jgi:hypothetical protein
MLINFVVTMLYVLEWLGDDATTIGHLNGLRRNSILLPFPAKDILADVARALGTDAG